MSYARRLKHLRSLGFKSYPEYLKSDLWKRVRARVFLEKGQNCSLCANEATQVHHNRYHRNDLIGKKLSFLVPICRRCHELIEHENGKKLKHCEVRRKYERLRKVAKIEVFTSSPPVLLSKRCAGFADR